MTQVLLSFRSLQPALAGDSHSGKGAASAGEWCDCQEGCWGIRPTHSLAWAAVTDSFDGTSESLFFPFRYLIGIA